MYWSASRNIRSHPCDFIRQAINQTPSYVAQCHVTLHLGCGDIECVDYFLSEDIVHIFFNEALYIILIHTTIGQWAPRSICQPFVINYVPPISP